MWYRRRGSWSSDSDDGCPVEVGLVLGAPAPPPVMVVQTAPMVQPVYTSSTVVVPGAYPSMYPMGVVPPVYQYPQQGVGYYPSPPPIPGPYPPGQYPPGQYPALPPGQYYPGQNPMPSTQQHYYQPQPGYPPHVYPAPPMPPTYKQ